MVETEFRLIILNNKDRVFNICLNLLKNIEDAEDLSQEVFIEFFEKYKKFRGESSVSTWIYKIAVNKCLGYLRKMKALKRRGKMLELDTVQVASTHFYHPGALLEIKEDAAMIFEALEHLPSLQRIAFSLRFIEDLPNTKVSKIMDKSVSSVESLLHRAKQNLKKKNTLSK